MIDRRLLDVRFTILGISNAPTASPLLGDQYIVAVSPTDAFADAQPNDIAIYDGSAWLFIRPKLDSLEVLDLSTSSVLRFNGSNWVTVASLGGGAPTTELHTITAEEISDQRFTLAGNISVGKEHETSIVLFGVTQTEGVDFTAQGNQISWANKGLASVELVAGDVFVVRYY